MMHQTIALIPPVIFLKFFDFGLLIILFIEVKNDSIQETSEIKNEELLENKFDPSMEAEQIKQLSTDVKKEEIEEKAEKNYPPQVDEHPMQSPTALQDPSTISLHSTDIEPNTSTSSPLPIKSNTQSISEDVQKPNLNPSSEIGQRYEEPPALPPPQKPKDLWYDIGVFIENKCFVTHFIQNITAVTNQEVWTLIKIYYFLCLW